LAQIHRRARALRKLAKQLTEEKLVLSSKSLQNYIMPYATTAIFNEKMLKVGFKLNASILIFPPFLYSILLKRPNHFRRLIGLWSECSPFTQEHCAFGGRKRIWKVQMEFGPSPLSAKPVLFLEGGSLNCLEVGVWFVLFFHLGLYLFPFFAIRLLFFFFLPPDCSFPVQL